MSRSLSVPGSNLFITHAPGDFSRIFVVSQLGTIRIVRLPQFTVDATPFLIVPNVTSGGETGLLSLAFHPNYAENGYLYVYQNRSLSLGTPAIVRFTRSPANPDTADPASALNILNVGLGNGIHNGGWIGFGPDGMLWISAGDAGSSSNARDLTNNLRGKILRIDVDGDDFPADATRNYRIPPGNPFVGIDGDDEIYAFGLRNPWRCSIDPQRSAMIIGDVGTGREELNVLPLAYAGADFGWPCQEGPSNNCPPTATVILPIAHYRSPAAPPLNIVGNAVIGGEIYRGCAIPPLRGRYFFGDLSGDKVSLRTDGVTVSDVVNHTAELSFGAYGFGHDAHGELYMAQPNQIARISPAVTIGRDCNANGIPDACDLASGVLIDANADGVPDECPFGDLDGDGQVGVSDLSLLLAAFGACAGEPAYTATADFNSDACNNLHDLALLLGRFGQ
jgi:glucose/arabinose dehydrogenase